MTKYKILILILCLTNYLSGQDEFSGQVIDESSGKPVSGATITEFPTTSGTFSDSLGFFKIRSVYKHPTFDVSHKSYKTFRYKSKKRTENNIVVPMTKAIYFIGELNISLGNIDHLIEQSICNYSYIKNTAVIDTNFVLVESYFEYPGDFTCLDSLFLSIIYKDIVNKSILPFGIVDIYFTINEQGYPINPTISREIPELLLRNINRIFELMPQWRPATQRGQNIVSNVTYRIRYE